MVGQIESLKYQEQLYALAQKLGVAERVFFTGAISPAESLALMSSALAVVSASSHEGRPNSILEAMKLGVPVILSDIPAHRELLDLSSMLFSTPEMMAASVQQLSNPEVKSLVISKGKRLTDELSWESSARSYVLASS